MGKNLLKNKTGQQMGLLHVLGPGCQSWVNCRGVSLVKASISGFSNWSPLCGSHVTSCVPRCQLRACNWAAVSEGMQAQHLCEHLCGKQKESGYIIPTADATVSLLSILTCHFFHYSLTQSSFDMFCNNPEPSGFPHYRPSSLKLNTCGKVYSLQQICSNICQKTK